MVNVLKNKLKEFIQHEGHIKNLPRVLCRGYFSAFSGYIFIPANIQCDEIRGVIFLTKAKSYYQYCFCCGALDLLENYQISSNFLDIS